MCCFPSVSNSSSNVGKSNSGVEGEERRETPEILDTFRRIDRFLWTSSDDVEVGEIGGSSSFWEDDLTPLSVTVELKQLLQKRVCF